MAKSKRLKRSPEPTNENDVLRRKNRQSTYLDEQGREMPNPTPLAPPLGYKKQPSIREQIRNMVRSEQLRQAADASGVETFEEADDFDVGDDYDPTSPYEEVFEPMPTRDVPQEIADKLAAVIAPLLNAEPGAAASPQAGDGGGGTPPRSPSTTTNPEPQSVGVPTPSTRLFSR